MGHYFWLIVGGLLICFGSSLRRGLRQPTDQQEALIREHRSQKRMGERKHSGRSFMAVSWRAAPSPQSSVSFPGRA
jgi:hypothetical protein